MSKRQKDMKSKLMAAICMLLVSSIMMVSTTYAWFTLSTAPEVTGITTAVGANGNLEMALLPPTVPDFSKLDDTSVISSAVGDSKDASGQTLKDANVTWGNLVDLSDNATYGTDQIVLNPAKLNEITNVETGKPTGKITTGSPLQIPKYGADGRVTEVTANGVTSGIYAGGTFTANESYGVRAVGTSSSMTPRQAAYRSAVQTANAASSTAKSLASSSISANGGKLANIALKKINEGETQATYTQNDVEALRDAAVALNSAVSNLETSMRNYLLAHNLAYAPDDQYETIQTTISASGMSDLKSKIESKELSAPSGFDEAYAKLYGTNNDGLVKSISEAVTAAEELVNKNEGSYTWDTDINPVLSRILDKDKMTLNGISASAITNDQMSAIVSSVLKNGVNIGMPSGSGAYADIADFVGDYSVIVHMDSVTAQGVQIDDLDVNMQAQQKKATETDPATNVPYLKTMSSTKMDFVAGDSVSTSVTAITDYYGYIIDLAFRTNATDSYLQLQTDAIDRIYGTEGKNEDVMGNGSSMTFTSAKENNFPATRVAALMDHIRVIFFATDTGEILAEARLDTAGATTEGATVTAPLKVWDSEGKKFAESAKITDLAQNKAKAVSALVYLDGESITNADVANASSSMTGSMNLQFSSSVTLVPMEYSDLKSGSGTTSGTTYTVLDANKVTLDSTALAAGFTRVTYAVGVTTKGTTDTNGVAVVLAGDNTEITGDNKVWLSVNGGEAVAATAGTYSSMSGYGITVDSAVESSATIKVYVGIEKPSDTASTADSGPASAEDSDPSVATANT